jgi:hypothetical protein
MREVIDDDSSDLSFRFCRLWSADEVVGSGSLDHRGIYKWPWYCVKVGKKVERGVLQILYSGHGANIRFHHRRR